MDGYLTFRYRQERQETALGATGSRRNSRAARVGNLGCILCLANPRPTHYGPTGPFLPFCTALDFATVQSTLAHTSPVYFLLYAPLSGSFHNPQRSSDIICKLVHHRHIQGKPLGMTEKDESRVSSAIGSTKTDETPNTERT